MLIYAGIDEAGYGPMFGPLSVAATTFAIDEYDPAVGAPDLWQLLKKAVAPSASRSRSRLVVNDSKKLKLPNNGPRHPLTRLEPAVLAFMLASDTEPAARMPATDLDFARQIDCDMSEAVSTCAWYGGEEQALPVAGNHEQYLIHANVLNRALQRARVRFLGQRCHFLTEYDFNDRVSKMHSKAATSFMLVGRHLNRIFNQYGSHHPRIIVDRQGARMHYREPLQILFPQAAIRIIAERDTLARYELTHGDRIMTITFAQSAEEAHFPVALASMLAKYVRELMMMRFNRYFQSLAPQVRPTAGYVQDGRRFLEEITPTLKQAGIRRRDLVRMR